MKTLWQRAFGAIVGERGQGMVEYVLLISLVAIALVGAILEFQNTLTALYTSIVHGL